MKNKIRISLLLILVGIASSYAKPVEVNSAMHVAKNIYWERINAIQPVDYSSISLKLVDTRIENGRNMYYIFNLEGSNEGFVIVSSDDLVYPVLAYSFEESYSKENQPENFIVWMNNLKEQILFTITNDISPDNKIIMEWQRLLPATPSAKRGLRSVSPLCNTTWDQDDYYNAACPSEASGPNGHVYAGCVATAIGQVMKYHNHPAQGTSSHSYYHPTYGTLSANFGLASYNWSGMPNSISSYNTSIATLLYHLGVSVEMSYSATGSGAYTQDAADALKDYFGYKSSTEFKSKSSYTTYNWENLLKTELDNNRPMIYRGHGSAGGHAWVCDGYQGSSNNYFHFNWGWSGSYNGYFYVTNLSPGSYDFTSYQGAIIGIEPITPPSTSLGLNDAITVTPSTITKNQSVDVWVDVGNFSTTTSFSGDFSVDIYNSSGQWVENIEEKLSMTLNANSHYTNGLTFSSTSVSAVPGTYSIAAFYKPSGGNWTLIDEKSYTNPVSVQIVSGTNPADIALYSALSVSPDPIIENQAFSVMADIANWASTGFSGEFAMVLHNSNGAVLDIIEQKTSITLGSMKYYDDMVFQTTGIIAPPGQYMISLQHKPDGGSWSISDPDVYTNPININIISPTSNPDQYESNNSEGNPYPFNISFSGSTGGKKSVGSNIHNDTDIDYYKFDLPSGYDYTINSRVHDEYNSDDGNTYSCDVQFAYKTANWSTEFDDEEAYDFTMYDGGTVIFRVEPYYSGDKGTYLLDVSMTRSASTQADLLIQNESLDPIILSPGSTTSASCSIKNQGNGTSSSNTVKYYLSNNYTKSENDLELGLDNIGNLSPLGTAPVTETLIIPSNTTDGTWYILFVADANDDITESDENNNIAHQQISVQTGTSINENFHTKKVKIYPNPSDGRFQVSVDNDISPGAYAKIWDVRGKLVHTENIYTDNADLNFDLSESESGIFIFELFDGESVTRLPLVIK